MMIYPFSFVIFLLLSSFIYSEDVLPEYSLMDLGTLETDKSEAIAINEQGQVLGWFEDRGQRLWFLWEQALGLQVINLPNSSWNAFRLNNKGQVLINGEGRPYLYDCDRGFIEIASLGGQAYARELNDAGQVIGESYFANEVRYFFWSNGKIIDLNKAFQKTFGGTWDSFSASNLTQDGSVLIQATELIKKNDGEMEYGRKTFTWKEGVFSNISDHLNYSQVIDIEKIGEAGSLFGYSKEHPSIPFCFINSVGEMFKAFDDCDKILEDSPIRIGYLLGKVKRDHFNNLYYAPGLRISKLFKENFPFYKVSEARINDQNSKNMVVGRISTLYPADHAFIAFPKKQAMSSK